MYKKKLNVCFCDDEPFFQRQLSGVVAAYIKNLEEPVELKQQFFQSGEELLKHIDQGLQGRKSISYF